MMKNDSTTYEVEVFGCMTRRWFSGTLQVTSSLSEGNGTELVLRGKTAANAHNKRNSMMKPGERQLMATYFALGLCQMAATYILQPQELLKITEVPLLSNARSSKQLARIAS